MSFHTWFEPILKSADFCSKCELCLTTIYVERDVTQMEVSAIYDRDGYISEFNCADHNHKYE